MSMKHVNKIGEFTLVKMTLDEWSALPDHPKQRNTTKHLVKLLREIGKIKGLTTNRVAAVRFPDGVIMKVDGHTRTLGWNTKALQRPSEVVVEIISVQNIGQALDVYDEYNNHITSKDGKDEMYSLFKVVGFSSESTAIRDGGVRSALSILGDGREIKYLVNEWINEIRTVDTFNCSKRLVTSGYLSAAFLSVRKHGDAVYDFWNRFASRAGAKSNGKLDAVEALSEHLQSIKIAKQKGGSGNLRLNCNFALGCVEQYLLNKDLRKPRPKPVDSTKYLESL